MRRRVAVCVLAALFAIPANGSADGEQSGTETGDCGTVSLRHLLNLEGRPAALNQLTAVLGIPGADGFSFRELREAARRFGLMLDAVVLPKQRSAIKRPAILFIKREREGHFLVVRPVGHTGHLVQVLDGERLPFVIDADQLFASPSWTGLALIPHRRNYLFLTAVSLSSSCFVAFAVLRRIRRVQRPSATPRSVNGTAC